MTENLFVCGTLLPELVPDHLRGFMRSCASVGEAFVSGRLYDLGKYPGAILDTNATERIRGWIYQLPDDPAVLLSLDDYEGIDRNDESASLFIRQRVKATMATGEKVDCWIYTYNRSVHLAPIIDGGDYLQHLAARNVNDG
ncbi:MAG: gamma-glutamylcyclotransferase family protein [Pyrinomonadaceae bacterium]